MELKPSEQKTILSCIQPTGDMHFGNYFGAIKNWVQMQQEYRCYYGIVDYHAITMPYASNKLREQVWDLVFNLLACGVDINNLFIQSMIPEHAELAWILGCSTAYGELNRMTQFKDKSQQVKEKQKDQFVSAGLFFYPVLQAADILIYHADLVPVGKDQEQHLELTRNIALRFNQQFGVEYFTLPQSKYTETPKIMSPADPARKMGKSYGSKHYISVFAESKTIEKQIRSAVTDPGSESGDEMSAGVKNLFELLKAAGNTEAYQSYMHDYHAHKLLYKNLKQEVANTLINISEQFRMSKAELLSRKKEVKDVVKDSTSTIRRDARQTLKEVKEICGLMAGA